MSTDDDCIICGQPHPKCSAHKKHVTPPRPCMNNPSMYHKACRQHGGDTPAARANAEKIRMRVALEADAQSMLVSTGDEGVPDILAAMERIGAQQIAWAEGLGARVEALTRLRYDSNIGTEQLRAEVQMLERAWPAAIKTLETIAKYRPDGAATAAKNLLTSLAEKLDDLGDA